MIIDTNDELTKLTKPKVKRGNKKVEEKKNEFIDSSLPEEAIVTVPYIGIEY